MKCHTHDNFTSHSQKELTGFRTASSRCPLFLTAHPYLLQTSGPTHCQSSVVSLDKLHSLFEQPFGCRGVTLSQGHSNCRGRGVFQVIAFKCMMSWDCLCLFTVQFLTLQLNMQISSFRRPKRPHRSPNSLSHGTGSLPTKTVSLQGNDSKAKVSLLGSL